MWPFSRSHRAEHASCFVRAVRRKLVKLFKKPKSKFYWYDFTVRGRRYRASAHETKSVRALQIVSLTANNSCPGRINVEPGSCGPAAKAGPQSSATQNRTSGRGSEGIKRNRDLARKSWESRARERARQERRIMSAPARKRIAAAQHERWAKWKAAKRSK